MPPYAILSTQIIAKWRRTHPQCTCTKDLTMHFKSLKRAPRPFLLWGACANHYIFTFCIVCLLNIKHRKSGTLMYLQAWNEMAHLLEIKDSVCATGFLMNYTLYFSNRTEQKWKSWWVNTTNKELWIGSFVAISPCHMTANKFPIKWEPQTQASMALLWITE